MKTIKTKKYAQIYDGGGQFFPDSQEEADEYMRVMNPHGSHDRGSSSYFIDLDSHQNLWYVYHTGDEVGDEPIGGYENGFVSEQAALQEKESFEEQDDDARISRNQPSYESYDPEYDIG